MFSLLGVFILHSVFVIPSQGETDCYYYYTSQPSQDDTCNPWPLVTGNGINSSATLTLHCNIMAARDSPLPNIQWFRLVPEDEPGRPRRIYPGGSDNKYSGPISVEDISNSFKMVNVSLVVHNVNDGDAGCYFCQVIVCSTAPSRCFDVRPSSRFCLFQPLEYESKVSCLSMAVNLTSICASSNWSCDPELGLHTDLPPLTAISTASVSSLTTSVTSLSTDLSLSVSTNTGTMSKSTLIDSSSSLSGWTQMDPISFSSSSPSNDGRDTVSQSSVNSPPELTTLTSELSTTPRVRDVQTHSQLNLRMGLYIVVGVCSMLLVVILILLAIVAVLCRKKPLCTGVKKHRDGNNRRSASLSIPGQLDSKKRTRLDNTDILTNIEEENTLHILSVQPPSSHITTNTMFPTISEDSSSKNWSKGSQEKSPSERSGSHKPGSPSVPMAAIEREKELGRSKESLSNHRVPLINEERENSHMTTKHGNGYLTERRSSSPEAHYYHVLEDRQYHNSSAVPGSQIQLLHEQGGRRTCPNCRDEGSERVCETKTRLINSYGCDCFLKPSNFDISSTRPHDSKEEYDWSVSLLPTVRNCKWEKPNTKYTNIDLSLRDQRSEYMKVNFSMPQSKD